MMKSVFSCSDFLSDLWPSGADGTEGLEGVACVASEGGSTQLVRDASTDLLNLLDQTQEAESNSRLLSSFAASSSNRQEASGNQAFAGQPVDSSVLRSSLPASQAPMPQPFLSQATTGYHALDRQSAHSNLALNSPAAQGTFHMDPVLQAKAICNHGVSVTALQQQLAELKGKASGLENIIRTGMQNNLSPCFPEVSGRQHQNGTAGNLDSLTSSAPAQTPGSGMQSQSGLQDYQLRQLAALLGSANMAALQSLAAAPSNPQGMPDTRPIGQQPASSAKANDQGSGDDDSGALQELHKLSGLIGDGPLDDGELCWEAKLDKSLPPPEMKRMRRMLSNRESARRSRRRKQAHMQDLEVQNNELVEANEKLQKELSMLRSLAKEAILEKKKSQAALEGLKHQVVQMLTERKLLPKQEGPNQDAAPPASTDAAGTDSNASGSEQLAVATSTTLPTASPTQAAPDTPQEKAEKPSGAVPSSPQETADKPKQAMPQKGSKSPKAPVSPRSGLKRKAVELC